MKKFILEMDEDMYCKCVQCEEWFGLPMYCSFGRRSCKGDIINRPEWCPLVEVENEPR